MTGTRLGRKPQRSKDAHLPVAAKVTGDAHALGMLRRKPGQTPLPSSKASTIGACVRRDGESQPPTNAKRATTAKIAPPVIASLILIAAAGIADEVGTAHPVTIEAAHRGGCRWRAAGRLHEERLYLDTRRGACGRGRVRTGDGAQG